MPTSLVYHPFLPNRAIQSLDARNNLAAFDWRAVVLESQTIRGRLKAVNAVLGLSLNDPMVSLIDINPRLR